MSLLRGPRLLPALAAAVALGACGAAEGPDLRPPVDAVADEEYAVLRVALLEHAYAYGAEVLVVGRDTTACEPAGWLGCDSYDLAFGPFPAPPADAFEDFLARNAATAALAERLVVDMVFPVVLLSADDQAALSRAGDFFGRLRAAYPGSHGVFNLGRVGFNRSMDTALVAIGNQSAMLGGEGYLELYRKIDGRWVRHATRATWIS